MTPQTAAVLHGAFEWTGIFIGVRLYARSSKTSWAGLGQTRQFGVILGCIVGAAIGNKAVHWLQRADQWDLIRDNPWVLLQGQSIVGGLLGGLIGVEIGKRIVGVSESTGDRFVTPILVGLIVGRIGCLLAGLYDDTYGVPTSATWAVNLGDGVPRHPTAVYDMLFAASLLLIFRRWGESLARESGLKFKLMLAGYLAWRLAIDALKPVPFAYVGGLSGIQLMCTIALVLYSPLVLRQLARLRS